jgi:hypothetical protein
LTLPLAISLERACKAEPEQVNLLIVFLRRSLVV